MLGADHHDFLGKVVILVSRYRLSFRLLACLMMFVFIFIWTAGCSPAKSGGIACAEAYLGHLIAKDYAAAYELLSDFDKQNISRETYLRWKESVAQIIDIESATVDRKVDTFSSYKYQGTSFGLVLGLKISRQQKVLKPDIELDGYNTPDYRQMVVYENKEWRMLLLLTKLDETVAAYEAILKKSD
jgi:hypothetical protein